MEDDASQDIKIALLEKDMSNVNVFTEKLNTAIEKLCDVSNSIKELLSIHDHKINKQGEVNDQIFTAIKDLKSQNHEEHVSTGKRIEQLEKKMDEVVKWLDKWKYMLIGAGGVLGFLLTFIANYYKVFTG